MKYSIYINQFCWKMNDFSSLDVVDLALYDAIKSFILSDKCETIIIDHQVYYWVSPVHLIEEMPILGINTTRGINIRIDKLIGAELLERCPQNQSTKKTYVKMGRKYNLYECYSPNENEISELGKTIPSVTTNNFSKDNNTNIDKINIDKNMSVEDILKDKRRKFAECCEKYVPTYGRAMIDEFINYWSEANGSKLRCEIAKQKSGCFEISRRLATWASRNNFNGNSRPAHVQPTAKKPIWEELGMTYEQYKSQFK